MNCNGRVVNVLIQRLAQHTHVLFKVVPQEVEDIMGPGVDHVTNSLQQNTTVLLHDAIFSIPVTCKMWCSLTL